MSWVDDGLGKNRGANVRYLQRPPVGCPRCGRGVMVLMSGANGDMYTCGNACGQRYWVDRDAA